MRNHSSDCLIGSTGYCTCTQELGQPTAQITRKRLVEEYQLGLHAGVEIGKADGFIDGRHAGYAAGFAEGREAAIKDMVAQMEAGPTAGAPAGAEPPDYIQSASPKTQEAWETLHAKPESPSAQSAWNEILYGRDDGKTAEDITRSLGIISQPEVPTNYPHHIGAAMMLYVIALALGAGMIVGAATWFLDIGYPFLWGVGVAVATFCSIIIKLELDARKKL